ncbi:MAG: response regulator [Muribaculaceae bacterium]|nr:response regulator [Muribaculaceae bacterium]
MNVLLKTLLPLLLILYIHNETHAESELNFVNVKSFFIEDGMSQNLVQQMVQDSDNFIWMATWNGLEKFDGYSFRNFKSYPTDSTRLAFNRMPGVSVGPNNVLWCETYDSRMFIFDTRDERFIDVFALHPDVKPCEEFVRKFCLKNGVIWLAALDGSLWRIDGNRYTERGSVRFFQATRPERGETIHNICLDGNGEEWIFSNKGYWVYNRAEICGSREFRHSVPIEDGILLTGVDGSLAVADINDRTIRDIEIDTRISDSSPPYLLSDGRVALVTPRGVGILDTKKESIVYIDVDLPSPIAAFYEQTKPEADGILWALTDEGDVVRIDMKSKCGTILEKPYRDSISSLNMQFLHQDSRGEIWVFPLNGHLCHYNKASGKLERVYTYNDKDVSLVPDLTFYMVDDRDNLWGGTKRGIHKFTFPTGHTRSFSNRNSQCRGLMLDSYGRLWTGFKDLTVSIYDSVYRYVGNLSPTGRIIHDETMRFGASIYAFLEDSHGRIWLGSRNDGLFLASPKNDGQGYHIQNFRHSEEKSTSLSNDAVYSIYEDLHHRIWIGTYGGGLNLVEQASDGTISFKNAANGGLPTYPNRNCRNVRYITCSSKGEMMLGTSGGFVTFARDFKDPAKIKFHRNWCDISRDSTLSNSDVLYVMEDSRHNIWLAVMSGGICRLTGQNLLSDNLSFSYINQRSGLPSDMVYSMREDSRGKIWITSEKAICRYDYDTDSLDVFDSHDFHHSLLLEEAPFVIDERGIASFGISNGMLQLDLRRLAKSEYVPNLMFCEVRLQTDEGTEKLIRIKTDEALDLAPEYRNISVSFVALDYCDPDNISYAYRLRGFNDHWIDNGHNRTASFYALPAGEYVLEVKATNSEGVWNDRIYSLPLRIRPTFIETIWAKLLYVLAFIAIVLAVWYIIIYILRLQRSINMERELTALKLKFFTDVSHELRTPLTLIINPIDEVLADKSLSSQSREYMSVAKSNTDRMLRLINQVLDIRKIQNNRMKIYLERVDIMELLEKMHHDFSDMANLKSIDFRFACDLQERMIYTDVDKLEKIVFNLLSNAFKYTPDGKSITLAAACTDNQMRITVSDEGPGMEDWQKNALFRRFETFGRKRRSLSSGIGLSLVKELTDILHGSVSVSSAKGEGSSFTVTLPCDYEAFSSDTDVELILRDNDDTSQEQDIADTPLSESDSDIPLEKGMTTENERLTVMIVEDNGELRRMIEKILHDRYNVMEAEDGAVALQLLSAGKHPDIIISDIMMPEIDGLSLLKHVRNNPEWSHIPFVLLSAKAAVLDQIEGLECGADDYLTKPFSSSYLRARLASIVNRRSRLRDFFLRRPADTEKRDETTKTDTPVPLTGRDSEFVRDLMKYIEENAQRSDLTIDEIASAMNFGRSIFNRKVKALLNSTPVELLSSVRMRLARALLLEGNLTVAEITYRCGFSSPQYFNRVFKAAHGCTPGEFIRQKPTDLPST